METRTLSTTGLKVSRLCCGTMTFGGQADRSAAARMVDTCLDHGINFIDTANVYNQGASESLLGEILSGRRDRVVLASKVAAPMGSGPNDAGLSRDAIRRAIDESLRRLRTDHLDLYYLHWPDYNVPVDETVAAMEELREAGKIRFVGASNYASWQVCELQEAAARQGAVPVAVAQPMYNLLARGIEQEFLPMCQARHVATVVYNPLAGGLLTGKQRFEAPVRGTRFDGNQAYVDRYWHEVNFEAVQRLAAAARADGRSLISVALNWILHHTPVDCVILGASRPEQLEENLRAAAEGPLSPELLATCDAVWARLRGPAPRYNR